MRPSCAAALLLTLLLSAGAGCQQTSQPTAGTPTTPIGPLAPTSPGAAGPSLGPFGAPTRVPPPATGSYNMPNNYLGGSAAGGQAYSPRPAPQNYVSSTPGRLQPLAPPAAAAPLQPSVGSGVRQTGWSGSAGRPNQTNTASQENTTGASDPRLGGMPVNDLTGAPPPPGYAAPPQRYGAGAGTFRGYRQPSSVPEAFSTPTAASAGSGADHAAPAPGRPELPALPQQPTSSSGDQATADAPSTEPAPAARDGDSKLPWRRPGSQY